MGPALDVQVTLQYGRSCIEIKTNSLQIGNTVLWAVINRGLDRYDESLPISERVTALVRHSPTLHKWDLAVH